MPQITEMSGRIDQGFPIRERRCLVEAAPRERIGIDGYTGYNAFANPSHGQTGL
jgi:hypothetical protein